MSICFKFWVSAPAEKRIFLPKTFQHSSQTALFFQKKAAQKVLPSMVILKFMEARKTQEMVDLKTLKDLLKGTLRPPLCRFWQKKTFNFSRLTELITRKRLRLASAFIWLVLAAFGVGFMLGSEVQTNPATNSEYCIVKLVGLSSSQSG